MNEEIARLIEDNTRLYHDYFYKHGIYDEDMKQELMLNLCQRADSFDPNRGKFTTFVYSVFNSSVANYIKHSHTQKDKVNHESVRLEDKNMQQDIDADYHEIIADTFNNVEECDYQIMLQDILERVSNSNVISKPVFRAYISWLKTDSFADSGRELKVSRQFIQNSVKKVQKYIQSIPGVDWRK